MTDPMPEPEPEDALEADRDESGPAFVDREVQDDPSA